MSTLKSGQIGRLDQVASILSTDTFLVNTRNPGDSVNTFLAECTAAQIVDAGFAGGSLTLNNLTVLGTTTLNVGLNGGLEASSGLVTSYALTAAGKALLDDNNASEQRTTLGLGNLAVLNQVDTAEIADNAITEIKLSTALQDKINPPPNVVYVDSLSDFPDPVGGVITLVDDTAYLIRGIVNVATNRIAMASNTTILGLNNAADILVFTGGSGDFITVSDVNAKIQNLTINAAGSTGVNAINTAGNEKLKNLIMDNVAFIGATFVESENLRNLQITNFEIVSATAADAISFSGTQAGNLDISHGAVTSFTTNAININTSVFDIINIDHILFPDVGAGKTAIIGAASDANLSALGRGVIKNCKFDGAGTYISGIAISDLKWKTIANENLSDSQSIGLIYFGNNAVTTPLTQNIPAKILGTTVFEPISQRFSMPSSGVLQYDGLEDTVGLISFFLSAELSRTAEYTFYKNGSVLNATIKATHDGLATGNAISLQTIVSMTTGDQFEVYVTNIDDNTDVTVTDFQLMATMQL